MQTKKAKTQHRTAETAGPEVGQRATVEISGMGEAGEGVGRIDGFTVFVPQAIPGERVAVEVTEVRRNFARGRLLQVEQAAPAREQPPCAVAGECGGCQLQHIDYDEQLRLKTQQVRDALERIGKLDPGLVRPILGAADPWGYRNKAQFPVGIATTAGGAGMEQRVVAGPYAMGTHRIIDTDSCLIQHPLNNAILTAAKRLIQKYGYSTYNEQTGQGLVRHVLARAGVRTGQALAVVVTSAPHWPRAQEFARDLMQAVPALVGVVQNVNPRRTNVILGDEIRVVAGRGEIEDEILGLRFRISARSFFQVNTVQTEVLYRTALEAAGMAGDAGASSPAVDLAIDAFCGIGTITLLLARHARRVIGLEEVEPAVRDARLNAELNGITNAEFHAGLVEDWAPRLLRQGLRPDVLVLDPPRKGCDAVALDAFVQMQPQRIAYVSCNPATLARDLAYLAGRGYRTEWVQPVDMFPHTAHVECVAALAYEGMGIGT